LPMREGCRGALSCTSGLVEVSLVLLVVSGIFYLLP